MTGRRWIAALVVATSCALVSVPVAAQSAADVAAARDLFREGSQLAKDGKWEQARERLERSLRLKRASLTLYSLAIAEKNTGQLVEALENFRAFLAEPSTPATKSYEAPARDAIAELEKRVARISLKIAPADAPDLAVKVDGQQVPSAALDRPRLVNPGPHEVVAAARGFAEARQSVTVAEGGAGSVELTMTEDPDAAAPPPVLPTSTSGPAIRPTEPPPPTEPARVNRTVPLIFIGGGVAALAVGGTFGALGLSQASDAKRRDGPDADAARTKGIVADVALGVGVVAVGVGVVIWITGGPKKSVSALARAPGVRLRF